MLLPCRDAAENRHEQNWLGAVLGAAHLAAKNMADAILALLPALQNLPAHLGEDAGKSAVRAPLPPAGGYWVGAGMVAELPAAVALARDTPGAAPSGA